MCVAIVVVPLSRRFPVGFSSISGNLHFVPRVYIDFTLKHWPAVRAPPGRGPWQIAI